MPQNGFNGAAVSRPRIFKVPNILGRCVLRASMGPRSHDHGYPGAEPRCPQRGTSFNGAAVSRPRIPRCGASVSTTRNQLQWGRGLTTTDTRRIGFPSGPRTVLQWGRGLTTTDTLVDPERKATVALPSMGPQSCNRGYAAQWSPEFGWDMSLQKGRGLTTTDTRRS